MALSNDYSHQQLEYRIMVHRQSWAANETPGNPEQGANV